MFILKQSERNFGGNLICGYFWWRKGKESTQWLLLTSIPGKLVMMMAITESVSCHVTQISSYVTPVKQSRGHRFKLCSWQNLSLVTFSFTLWNNILSISYVLIWHAAALVKQSFPHMYIQIVLPSWIHFTASLCVILFHLAVAHCLLCYSYGPNETFIRNGRFRPIVIWVPQPNLALHSLKAMEASQSISRSSWVSAETSEMPQCDWLICWPTQPTSIIAKTNPQGNNKQLDRRADRQANAWSAILTDWYAEGFAYRWTERMRQQETQRDWQKGTKTDRHRSWAIEYIVTVYNVSGCWITAKFNLLFK